MSAEEDDELTNNSTLRWEWLASIIAGVTLVSFVSLIILSAFSIVSLTLPQTWFALYAGLLVTTATWVFGKRFSQFRE